MGCDIHGFVEYKRKKDSDHWEPFSLRPLNLDRDYWMFGLIAKGVRSDIKEGIEQRGLPENISWACREEFFLTVDDEGGNNDWAENFVTVKDAQKYVDEHGCKSLMIGDRIAMVENPNLHSFTWITSKELEYTLQELEKIAEQQVEVDKENNEKFKEAYPELYDKMGDVLIPKYNAPTYKATLAAMKALEESGYETRLVVAFDN